MSKIKTYKPNDAARIEALLFTESTVDDALEWMGDKKDQIAPIDDGWRLRTPEGWIIIPFGHYLVRGTHGEFYPVHPKIMQNRWVPIENTGAMRVPIEKSEKHQLMDLLHTIGVRSLHKASEARKKKNDEAALFYEEATSEIVNSIRALCPDYPEVDSLSGRLTDLYLDRVFNS